MPQITVFTTNVCAYCTMIKKWLTHKGFTYEEVNVEKNPERQQEAYKLSGSLAVPVVLVSRPDGTREVIVGYNLARLAPALTRA